MVHAILDDPCNGSCGNGVCTKSTGKCDCPSGWGGADCQTNINDCSGITCSNHGSCVDGIAKYTCDCENGWGGTDCELCNGANPLLTEDPADDCNGVTASQCETFPELLALCPIACDSCIASTTSTTITSTTTTATSTTTTGLCNGVGDPEECGHDEPYTYASCNLDSFAGTQIRKYCPSLCDSCITTTSTTTTTTGMCNGVPDPYECGRQDDLAISNCNLNTTIGVQVRDTCLVLCGSCITTTSTTTTTTVTATTTTIMCSEGEYFGDESGEAEQQTCFKCPDDTYQDSLSHRQTECIDQTLCKTGEVISQYSPERLQTCSQCPDWSYQPNATHRETECLVASVKTCGKAGNFNPGTGKCDCYPGYGGEDCTDVAAGCRLMDVGMESALTSSSNANIRKVLPPVAAVSGTSIFVSYVYLLRFGGAQNGVTKFSELSWKEHVWATMSVGLKIFDLGTDWGFLQYSLNGEAFESQFKVPDVNGTQQLRRFSQTGRYDPNVRAIQSVALASCVLGTQFTLLDIYGTHQRLGKVVKLASKVTLGVMIVEDIPQLIINLIYMDAIKVDTVKLNTTSGTSVADVDDEPDDSGIDTLSSVSLVASILNMVFSLYLMMNDRCVAAKQQLDEIELEEMRRNTMDMEDNPMHSAQAAVAKKDEQLARAEQDRAAALSENERLRAELAEMKRSAAKGKGKGPKQQVRRVPISNVKGFAVSDVGKACIITGVGSGIIRFVGLHAEKQEPRVGVEMNKPKGKNNGTVNGHKYFKCKDGHGLLTNPTKVVIKDEYLEVGGAGTTVGSNA